MLERLETEFVGEKNEKGSWYIGESEKIENAMGRLRGRMLEERWIKEVTE